MITPPRLTKRSQRVDNFSRLMKPSAPPDHKPMNMETLTTHQPAADAENLANRLARRFKLNLGLWRFYSYPQHYVKNYKTEGYVAAALKYSGQARMEKAARALAPLEYTRSTSDPEVHFLTGERFWHQTVFCLYSLNLQAGFNIRGVIHDDGTIDAPLAAMFRRVFPDVVIVPEREADARLASRLPVAKFPHLRGQRETFKLMRKVTDVHAATGGWKMFLDSDMIFHRRPCQLLDWLKSPQEFCYMVDVVESYGYKRTLLDSLTEKPLPDSVNCGITGINADAVDWERVEWWCKTLLERVGFDYFLEQSLTAMIFADHASVPIPKSEYLVRPERAEVKQPRSVLHHYVAESKAWYYCYAWQHVLRAKQTMEAKG